MSSATYFVQECPTCGRRLQVRLEYLGKTIACPYCEGRLEASDPAMDGAKLSDSSELLLKADALLASAETWKPRPR